MLDGCPLLHPTTNLALLTGTAIGMLGAAPIDKGASRGRVMQDLDQRGLGRLAPEELTSIQPTALPAG
jgi:hypothetical protein